MVAIVIAILSPPKMAGSALRTPQAIKGAIATFADLGVDELILDPTVSDPDQADRLADVAL